MKRTILWLASIGVATFVAYDFGTRKSPDFELVVHVQGDSVSLESAGGCSWATAEFGVEGVSNFAFVVDESGVRGPVSSD